PQFHPADHLAHVLRRARAGAPPSRLRHRATHRVRVGPEAAAPGELIRCWLPFPLELERQTGARLVAASSEPASVAPASAAQRTVFLEQTQTPGGALFEATFEFEAQALPPPLGGPIGQTAPLEAIDRDRFA